MNRQCVLGLIGLVLLQGCTPPPSSGPSSGGRGTAGLIEAFAPLRGLFPDGSRDSSFYMVGAGYFFTPVFCKYYNLLPPIPAGKRAHITIEDNENPTGVIEV